MGVAQGGLDVEGVVLVDITSPGQIGFVRVDNQFSNSPFYSGAASVCVSLADVWLAHFAFLSFPYFL